MATPPMSRKDALAFFAAIHKRLKQGYPPPGIVVTGRVGAVYAAMQDFNLSRSGAAGRVRRATELLGREPSWNLYAAPEVAPKAEPVAIDDALRARAGEIERANLRSQVAALQQRLLEEQDKLAAVMALKQAKLPRLDWTLAAPALAKHATLWPVLFSSDFQVGEVIRPEQVDGLNEYNQHVFLERYRLLVDKTIEMADRHVGRATFPGIHYLRGGDAISGEIHEDLAETNDLSAVPAARLVMQAEREGIRLLRKRFGRVEVVSLPGNHGRLTRKPRTKNYAGTNVETLLSWWLETQFADDPRVTFTTPESADAMLQIAGWSVLMSHGDRTGSRGGTGFVGPIATIARGHQKLLQNWSARGRPPHLILTGHLHTSVQTEWGYGNGSLAGYSELGRDIRATPDAAKQWLFFLHEKHKVAHKFELMLSAMPRHTSAREAA